MLPAVLRLQIVTADDHRITFRSIRHGIHLNKVNLALRVALGGYFGEFRVHIDRGELLPGTIPESVEVGLHVRGGHYLGRIDAEEEQLHRLFIEITTRFVESGLEIVGRGHHHIYRTFSRHLGALLDGFQGLLRIGAYPHPYLRGDAHFIWILDVEGNGWLVIEYPVVRYRHGAFKGQEFGRGLRIIRIVRVIGIIRIVRVFLVVRILVVLILLVIFLGQIPAAARYRRGEGERNCKDEYEYPFHISYFFKYSDFCRPFARGIRFNACKIPIIGD